MFSRFELSPEGGALYIRSVDIRIMRDLDGHTMLSWEASAGKVYDTHVQGTADENMERLRAEETAMLVASEKLRARQQSGMPSMPVIRGRK